MTAGTLWREAESVVSEGDVVERFGVVAECVRRPEGSAEKRLQMRFVKGSTSHRDVGGLAFALHVRKSAGCSKGNRSNFFNILHGIIGSKVSTCVAQFNINRAFLR